jgi:hypothetical protein
MININEVDSIIPLCAGCAIGIHGTHSVTNPVSGCFVAGCPCPVRLGAILPTDNPCGNCGCHAHESIVTKWDRRTQRVIASPEFKAALRPPSAWVANRLTTDATFAFGFSGWIASDVNDSLIGRFRAAVLSCTRGPATCRGTVDGGCDHWRFYMVQIKRHGDVPGPLEHFAGARLPMPQSTIAATLAHVTQLDAWSDEEWGKWLLPYMQALIDFVEAREALVVGKDL